MPVSSSPLLGNTEETNQCPPILHFCTSVGHVAVVALVFQCIRVAIILSIAAVLLVIVHAILQFQAMRLYSCRPKCLDCHRYSFRKRSVSIFLRMIAYHITSPMWLVVGWVVHGTATRLMVGVFLVSSPQSLWWETLVWLTMWMAVLVQAGEASSLCLWGPVSLFALASLNKLSHHVVIESGGFQHHAVQDHTLEIGQEFSKEFRKVVKSIPDWAPPTRKEFRAYRRAFKLHDELFGVYACSIRADPESLTHHGRLYISSGHVCFDGTSVMHHDDQVMIENSQILELRCGGNQEHGTLTLKRPTFMKHRHQPMMSIELSRCERGLAVLGALVRVASGEGDEEEDYVGSSDGEYAEADQDGGSDAETKQRLRSQTMSIFADGEPFQKLFEANLPLLALNQISSDLLQETWADDSLVIEYLRTQGATQISSSACVVEQKKDGIANIRELTMLMPVPPAPMCPKVTKMTMTYRVSVNGESGCSLCTIEASAASHDVPFGSSFLVQDQIKFQPSEDNSGIKATKFCRVVFLKSCGMLKGRIKSAAVSEQVKSGDVFVSVLRNRYRPDEEIISSVPSNASRTAGHCFSVWELQRRTTLFHSDWRAPFLPHERKFKWRWVDDSYRKHHWIVPTRREDAAAASYPPLDPGRPWVQIGKWTVSTLEDKGTDTEGWQYSIDFYRKDSFWSSSSRGCHCRRRLWTCTFAAAHEFGLEKPSDGPELWLPPSVRPVGKSLP